MKDKTMEESDETKKAFKNGRFQEIKEKNSMAETIMPLKKEISETGKRIKSEIKIGVTKSPLILRTTVTAIMVFVPYILGMIFVVALLLLYVGVPIEYFLEIHKKHSSVEIWTFGYFILSLLVGAWAIKVTLSRLLKSSKKEEQPAS